MVFHEKLMELRKERGWSQEELGNQLGVSRQTVSKWELGQTTPELSKLVELGNLFSISLDELLNHKREDRSMESAVNEAQGREVIYVPMTRHYEYKSEKQVNGIPLIHINVGKGFYRAKGIIAIGNIATGVIAAGVLSIGLLSFGILAFGLFALGCISLGGIAAGAIALGVFAVGGIAVGVTAIGGLAIGMYSIGGCAIASHIALGGYANGHIAIGEVARGTVKFVTGENLEGVDFLAVKKAILDEYPGTWKMIVELFTGILK